MPRCVRPRSPRRHWGTPRSAPGRAPIFLPSGWCDASGGATIGRIARRPLVARRARRRSRPRWRSRACARRASIPSSRRAARATRRSRSSSSPASRSSRARSTSRAGRSRSSPARCSPRPPGSRCTRCRRRRTARRCSRSSLVGASLAPVGRRPRRAAVSRRAARRAAATASRSRSATPSTSAWRGLLVAVVLEPARAGCFACPRQPAARPRRPAGRGLARALGAARGGRDGGCARRARRVPLDPPRARRAVDRRARLRRGGRRARPVGGGEPARRRRARPRARSTATSGSPPSRRSALVALGLGVAARARRPRARRPRPPDGRGLGAARRTSAPRSPTPAATPA